MSERKARAARAGKAFPTPKLGTPLAFRAVRQVFGRTLADPAPHWHPSGRALARLTARRRITGES